MSAPERSSLAMMSSERLTSVERVIREVWIVKMRLLVFSSGSGNSILRSILPGRIKAGSSVSILLVAMITYNNKNALKYTNNLNNTLHTASPRNISIVAKWQGSGRIPTYIPTLHLYKNTAYNNIGMANLAFHICIG